MHEASLGEPRRRLVAVLTFLALVGLTPAAADTSVGTLLSIRGDVRIDAFGKGAPIAAVEGEALYRESVINTGPDGTAVAAVWGTRVEIAPGSVTRVGDLEALQKRKGALGWLRSLGQFLGGVVQSARGREEQAALGSRAAEVESDGGFSWVEEEDEDEERYQEALGHIAESEYVQALSLLLELEYEETDVYTPFETAFWKGFSYFALESYEEAGRNLREAWELRTYRLPGEGANETVPIDRVLPFELGASLYLTGGEAAAVPYLVEVVSSPEADEYSLYAYLLLVPALAAQGDRQQAEQHLARARARFAGTELQPQIDELERSLK